MLLLKKLLPLLLLTALTVGALSGCSKQDAQVEATNVPANFAPETTAIVSPTETAQSLPEAVDIPLSEATDAADATQSPTEPTAAPQATQAPTPTVSSYSYTLTALNDNSFGFVCAYPTGWKNLPGKYTVCYREDVSDDDFAARVAITKKTFAHTPKASRVLSQFQSYAETIYDQYDPSTFEFGDLNSEAKFLGQQAYEITYLAYSGETEVKGYMICASVDRSIYVFHFCASYDDYGAMEAMMNQMRDTVTIVD